MSSNQHDVSFARNISMHTRTVYSKARSVLFRLSVHVYNSHKRLNTCTCIKVPIAAN